MPRPVLAAQPQLVKRSAKQMNPPAITIHAQERRSPWPPHRVHELPISSGSIEPGSVAALLAVSRINQELLQSRRRRSRKCSELALKSTQATFLVNERNHCRVANDWPIEPAKMRSSFLKLKNRRSQSGNIAISWPTQMDRAYFLYVSPRALQLLHCSAGSASRPQRRLGA